MMFNPSIERTSQGLRPCATSHVKRWAFQISSTQLRYPQEVFDQPKLNHIAGVALQRFKAEPVGMPFISVFQ
jgi:hypothetical protein